MSRVVAAVAILALAAVCLAGTCTLPAGETSVYSIEHQGLKRHVHVFVPNATAEMAEEPGAVFLLHGWNDNPTHFQQALHAFDELAPKYGLVTVYPHAYLGSWNGGYVMPQALMVDDVGFIKAVWEDLHARGCATPKRVYSTGFSAGAFLSYRLGCELPELFSAVAPLSGNMGDWIRTFPHRYIFDCPMNQSIGLLHWHGTSDPMVMLNGKIAFGLMHARSINETISLWSEKNGCDASQAELTLDEDDGLVVCHSSLCKDATTSNVTLCLVRHMPHGVHRGCEHHVMEFFSRFSKP